MVAQDVWLSKASFKGRARDGSAGFSVGGKGYVGIGRNANGYKQDFWEYDPVSDTWTQKADFAGPARVGAVAFSIGSKGYLGMAHDGLLTDFWEYDPAANIWTQKARFPGTPRFAAVAFSIGNKGYVGTGDNYYQYFNDFWEFDPVVNQWTQKANFGGTARAYATGFSIGNKGYIGTGLDSESYYTNLYDKDFWEYDPSTDRWTRKADFAGFGRNEATSFSIGTNGYLGTGFADGVGHNPYVNDFWKFDPTKNAWSQLADFGGEGRVWAIGFSIGDKGYIGLGANSTDSLSDFWEYNPKGSSQDTTPPTVHCPSAQTLCFSPSATYTIPLVTATDMSGIESVTYTITGATSRDSSGANASGLFNPGSNTISWKVSDSAGNSSTCETSVRVDRSLSVVIPDVYPLFFWGPANMLYRGIGPECADIVAVPAGGTQGPGHGYEYLWSTGSTSRFIRVCPEVAGPDVNTVTITDSLGCQATASKVITLVDVRCGRYLNKISVCVRGKHGYKEHCLTEREAILALFFGGHPGPCSGYSDSDAVVGGEATAGETEESMPGKEKKIAIFPNPNNGAFTLQLSNISASEIRIIDLNGRLLEKRTMPEMLKMQSLPLSFGHLPNGIYTVQVISKEGVYTCKMIVRQ